MHLWRVPETAERTWQREPAAHEALPAGLLRRTERLPQGPRRRMPDRPGGRAGRRCLRCSAGRDIGPSHGIVQLCAKTGLKQPPPKIDFPNQSSTWVIGPSRTASGRPIVFIDPHWPAEGQTSWWEFHVHTGRLPGGRVRLARAADRRPGLHRRRGLGRHGRRRRLGRRVRAEDRTPEPRPVLVRRHSGATWWSAMWRSA